ncbi:MAG: histidine ammonia-lyase [Candidatus Mcinerneyibacterium aminivorans]|uniref:Histidine ammonia-lyase n=1 Tax=Candidatus Mcinerneyibacterium aminivorans TaxID=2703815 RepID=A0A5D0MG13_9BACT|nr:MAG: histidine ammonia-lyase [Candidatus Mcinerneyibacterium aminivorans]
MYEIGSNPLTLEKVWDVAVKNEKVVLSNNASENIKKSRKRIESIMEKDEAVYGVNTGFGEFSNIRISKEKLKRLQKNLILSHSVGVGNKFDKKVVRAIMLLRINALSLGYSGISLPAVQTLIDMLNNDICPIIPEKGSVGASGDLAPLSHMVLVMIGEGKAEYKGEIVDARTALESAGIKPHTLLPKEGLALINGTQVMTAVGAIALKKAIDLSIISDIVASVTYDALLATDKALDERIHSLRPHTGQIHTADNLRKLFSESDIRESHLDCENVQDAYSLRAVPQVHGASKDTLRYVKSVLETEFNSVTDNPLIFEDEAISGGNFHGQPVALAMDYSKIAVAELGNISERRINRLIHPAYNKDLPSFLIEKGGINSGLMIPQYVAASLVSENKTLCHPASVDSISTSAGKEDHVSMGTIGARKFYEVVDNVYYIYAIELLNSTQALELRKPLKGSIASREILNVVREKIEFIEKDRYFKKDIENAYRIINNENFIEKIENKAGKLNF